MTKQKKEAAVAHAAVEGMIFVIRGQKVMIDRDLAKLYGVETRVLNQAVKRNIERFPDDFLLSLSREEIKRISQIVISSEIKFSKSVYAFTEQGVAMLSGVLNSKRAIQVNILIMRTFARLREMISGHKELAYKVRELERKVGRHDDEINVIIDVIKKLTSQPPKPGKPNKGIGFHVRD